MPASEALRALRRISDLARFAAALDLDPNETDILAAIDRLQGGLSGLNESPAFTGTPTAPTAALGTNNGQLSTTAFVAAALVNLIGTTSGKVPALGAGGKLSTSVLPAIAVTDTFVVASQAAMLALTAERGDVAIRTDLSKTFILATDNPGTLADWKEFLVPADVVQSVAGLTGAITAEQLRTALNITPSAPTHPGYVSGRIYPAFNAAVVTNGTVTANKIYAVPMVLHKPVSIASLLVDMNATGGFASRMAIYNNANGYPGSLVAQNTTSDTAGGNTSYPVATTLEAGIYWIAFQTSATPSVKSVSFSGSYLSQLGGGFAPVSGMAFALTKSQAYASFASTFPTGATVTSESALPIMGFTVA